MIFNSAPLFLVLFGLALGFECIGEFQRCPSGDCVFIQEDCGNCSYGEYLCPSKKHCVFDFAECPDLNGTFWDWTLPLETRLDLLVNATTLDEQINQLQNTAPAIARLSIPAYQWLNDDLHGLRGPLTTSYPDGNGLGATWSRETLFEVGRAIGVEARALHHFTVNQGRRGMDWTNGIGLTIYAPNVNLVRDPRWGRSQEVYSEDPYLTSQLVVAYVTGAQEQKDGYQRVGACCKHFAVYDVENFPTNRVNYNAIVDGRNLFESYFPAFEACVRHANVSHIMCSYNSINGVPACAQKPMLDGVLRERWGFDGFVVSDYDAWAFISETHHYCPNMTCSAAVGINAGMDQEGGGNVAISSLPEAVSLGLVTPARVAQAFRRLFRERIKLGMLDPPTLVPYANVSMQHMCDNPHMELALKAAREAIGLYKNKNSVLPLSGPVKNLAVIGPRATGTFYLQGNYADPAAYGVVSILEGIFNHNCPETGCSFVSGVTLNEANSTFVLVDTKEECCAACTADLSCNYFTFYDGQCFKVPTSFNAVTGVKGAVSGARPGLCMMTENVGYASPNDTVLYADDARECCTRCRVDPTCSKFTFVPYVGCYLNPTGKAVKIPGIGIVSGRSRTPKNSSVTYVAACDDGASCTEPYGFDDAVAAAKHADVVIVILGLDQSLESEGHDRTTIDLPANQYVLVDMLRNATSAPLIGVFVHGGTFAFHSLMDQFDAVLDAWYPGQQGGNGIADVLYGTYNPGSKATVTYYESDADLPPNLAQQDFYPNATYKGLTYRYFTGTPKVPFGFGLSYTTFEYEGLHVETPSIHACQDAHVRVRVRNTGSVIGDEVVQLYVTSMNTTTPHPQVRLAAFHRVKQLAPGASEVVHLVINPRFHAVVTNSSAIFEANVVVEMGRFGIFVGGGQPDHFSGGLTGSVTVRSTADLRTCY